MKVFLSHKSQEKDIVKKIKSQVEKSFIECWLDEDQIEGGATLHTKLINSIDNCDAFVAFVSERYLDSSMCLLEFQYANLCKKRIIVYLIGDAVAIKNKAKEKNITEITVNLMQDVYRSVNTYDLADTANRLAEDLQANEEIKFKPLEIITIGDKKLQHIHFEHENLEDDFLTQWSFDVKGFLSHTSTDDKLIKMDIPVAFSGRSPQWLIAHMVINFANNHDVFIYNNPSKAFIGVYSCSKNGNLGTVLPYNL